MVKKSDIKEFLVVIIMSLSLLSLALVIVYYIVDNYVDVDSVFGGNLDGKHIYILENVDNKKYIPYLKKEFAKEYKISIVKKEMLSKISTKRGVLFLISAKELDEDTIYAVENYVKKGGSLIFNYGNPKLIKIITKLNSTDIIPADTYLAQAPLLSPLQVDKKELKLYDDIYTYNKKAILDFTKNNNSYGVMWNGNYGKGNWIYFSFPFYIIKNNNLVFTKHALTNDKSITSLIKEIVDFSYYGYKVVKYPFVDLDKMVLINEYIDYKFNDNFIKFIEKNNIKTTIFVNPNIINKKLNYSDNVEIASMSDKDKWKLEKYTSQKVIGYSNENSKPNVKELYNKYGFKYLLGATPHSGIYYKGFVVLAHDGFNDINLEENNYKIKQNIDFFVKYKIYTITIHSYILGYKNNFEMLKDIINYAKKYPILRAKDIATKYKDSAKITMNTMLTPSSLAIQITNNTLKEIHNFTFRVYSKYKFDKIESNFFNINAKIIKETSDYVDVRVEKMNKNIEFYLRFKK